MTDASQLSPRQKAAHFSNLCRAQRTRFYISFNTANSFNPLTGRYTRSAWPILFKSRELAEKAMTVLPIFANSAAGRGRGRIKSASVESVVLR